jgi:putative ubiquitin-RnfH superfamily antitoxin RatB of RatAB toxin-antitoxin module
MRWMAPAHTSSVTISTGTFSVENGHVTLPAPLSDGDRAGLIANGFKPPKAARAKRAEPKD